MRSIVGEFADLCTAQAEEYFRRAIREAPSDVDVLLRYAFFLESARKSPDDAERWYRKATAQAPSVKTFYELGYFLQNTRRRFTEGTARCCLAEPS